MYMVDKATQFTAARLVRNKTSSDILKTIRIICILVYFIPPGHLHVDQGTNSISAKFKLFLHENGIKLKEAPV